MSQTRDILNRTRGCSNTYYMSMSCSYSRCIVFPGSHGCLISKEPRERRLARVGDVGIGSRAIVYTTLQITATQKPSFVFHRLG